ncbi:hypothetical protein [Thaumasiovibrio sp. DFM-14]|uniref:hypothetical protein n=1 Tax=Thaumasiovibrio sp. DFM-14 TaxID=3384792 RepID=UPI0039A3C377
MPRNYNDQTKITVDFGWLDNIQENTAKFSELKTAGFDASSIASKAKIILAPGYQMVRSDIDDMAFELALLCESTKEVVYYIKCQVWGDVYLNAKPITQVLLWRTSNVVHRRITSGLAEDIFRGYLLDEYNIVASDSCQTREGRDFWVRQLGYALQFGEFVYRFDRLNCELLQITDHATVRDNSCDLWGDEQEYENILAMISKDEIIL